MLVAKAAGIMYSGRSGRVVCLYLNVLLLLYSYVSVRCELQESVGFVHHSNSRLVELLRDHAATYPNLTRLYSIGRSVKGRELWVLEISDQPGTHELGEPEFKYVANMHGNEVTGREMLLHLAHHLLTNYSTNSEVRNLVDSTRIHLLMSMNPDGYEHSFSGSNLTGRTNANDVDLNRNFPDRFGRSSHSIQPETEAVMNWLTQYPFVLSANLHGGALVANYPYDNSQNGADVYTAAPDDDIFIQLALTYSQTHPTMHQGTSCGDNFLNGITNGAAWYSIDGSMQDYNYVRSGCMELTLEQSCIKHPAAGDLESLWRENKAPLIALIKEVHNGVRGFVVDEDGLPVAEANVSVNGRKDFIVQTAIGGDYWRLLAPGSYMLSVKAYGYREESKTVNVREGEVATVLNFTMRDCVNCTHDFTMEVCATCILDTSSSSSSFKLLSSPLSLCLVVMWVLLYIGCSG